MTWSKALIHHSLSTGPGSVRDLVDLETHEFVVRFAAHKAGVLGDVLKDGHDVAGVDLRDVLGEFLFVLRCRRRPGGRFSKGMMFPQKFGDFFSWANSC